MLDRFLELSFLALLLCPLASYALLQAKRWVSLKDGGCHVTHFALGVPAHFMKGDWLCDSAQMIHRVPLCPHVPQVGVVVGLRPWVPLVSLLA